MDTTLGSDYLESTRKLFNYYKKLGEKTIEQLPDAALFETFNEESNSIAVLVQHMAGNMLSRWTDFLNSDGEKPWRDRDAEFESRPATRVQLVQTWEEGWNCLFKALEALRPADLERIVYIRNEGHTVVDAISRQLAHYCYHVGQIVYIGKMAVNKEWKSLSIPRNNSNQFNEEKFSREKQRKHFTDDQG